MRVLNVISSIGVSTGGPARSTLLTVRGVRALGVDARIVACDVSMQGDSPISHEEFIDILPPAANPLSYSPAMGKYLCRQRSYDLYHIQGVWQYPGAAAARAARRYGKPYIITPRGMLYPEDIARGRLKKSLFLKLFLMRDLQRAACVHATCRQEMDNLRALGVTAPVAVIPNPVEVTGIDSPLALKPLVRVGYLGRVHRRKRVERLIYAWSELGAATRGMELVVIGDGDVEYMDFLRSECARLGVGNALFTGFLSGAAKDEALDSLSLLVVPSDFENFGNIVVEALVRGIPVVASLGTPWEELPEWGCGWWVANDVPSLTSTLQEALSLSGQQRLEMGQKGRELIKQRYTQDKVGACVIEMYRWIAQGGPVPPFVNIYGK